jgi:DNA (cytosine-5)-methyltransferase 1
MAGISPWGNSKLILCRDGKTRRVPAESLLFGMADGLPEGVDRSRVTGISETEGFPLTKETEGRVMLLRGYGNAIVPQVASEFVKAFMGN